MNNWQTLISFMSNNNIASFLDVGANDGYFTKVIENWFPNIKTFSIEANPAHEPSLISYGFPYKICCLSDEIKEVDFFISKLDNKSTGASYYKEKTRHYDGDNYKTIKVNTETLDSIFPNESFDFIKMDVQGAELDILKGGKKIVRKSRFIMLELTIIEYNEGAPLIDEVDDYMTSIGFSKVLKVGQNLNDHKQVHQEDWVYKNDIQF